MRESYRPNETATLVIETPPRTVGTQLLRVGERPSARRRDELPSAERFEPPDAHAGDRLDRGGPSAWPRLTAVRSTDSPRAPSCAGRQNEPNGSYGWPVKPFHSQHPVRGSFGDPRIGPSGNEIVRTFHFGIDVSAPDATPVYATATGTVSVHGTHPDTLLIARPDGSVFEYWHVIPAVRVGQHVVAYRTVLGHIATGWGHVHFAERRGGAYLNPLRSGAIFPYADTTCPGIGEVRFERAGIRQKARGLKGRLDIAVRAEDAPPLSAPAPWRELPVTPARVQWRIVGEHGSIVMPWQSVHDVRQVLPRGAFESVYTSDTRQNRPNRPGVYRFNLARGWDADPFRRASTVFRSWLPIPLATRPGSPSRSRSRADAVACRRRAEQVRIHRRSPRSLRRVLREREERHPRELLAQLGPELARIGRLVVQV